MVGLEESEHVGIVIHRRVRHQKIILLSSHIDAAALVAGAKLLRPQGRQQLPEISHTGQVVELAEAQIQVQSRFLVQPLEIAAVGVPALFEVGVNCLPVEVPGEGLCHLVDEFYLGDEVALEGGFDGCCVDLELVEIDIRRIDFPIGRVPLQKTSASVLLEQPPGRIGVNVDVVGPVLVQFLLVVDVCQLVVGGLVGDLEICAH